MFLLALLSSLLVPDSSKVALTCGFIGSNFHGSMYNKFLPTVEGALRDALKQVGAAPWGTKLKDKYEWSGTSRTDGGVSAVRLTLSMILLNVVLDGTTVGTRCPKLVKHLNAALKAQDYDCVVFDAIVVPSSFDARSSCSFREYKVSNYATKLNSFTVLISHNK